jgi:hypothetical protein
MSLLNYAQFNKDILIGDFIYILNTGVLYIYFKYIG